MDESNGGTLFLNEIGKMSNDLQAKFSKWICKQKEKIVIINGKNYHINVAQKFVENKYFWPRPSAAD